MQANGLGSDPAVTGTELRVIYFLCASFPPLQTGRMERSNYITGLLKGIDQCI